jgi:hypothetical protein
MSTKYVVHDYRAAIKACECTKETAVFVWFRGFHEYFADHITKQKKAGKVFDTWEEAHAELTLRADAKLSHASRQLELAHGFASNVRGMKPPQDAALEGMG